MTDFLLPVIFFHSISLLFMLAMAMQFHRIHTKRITLLEVFDSQGELQANITRERLQARLTILIYILSTIGITIISTFLFFYRPHWL